MTTEYSINSVNKGENSPYLLALSIFYEALHNECKYRIVAPHIDCFPRKGMSKRNPVFCDMVTERTGLQGALGRVGALQCRYSHCRLSSTNVNKAWRITADH